MITFNVDPVEPESPFLSITELSEFWTSGLSPAKIVPGSVEAWAFSGEGDLRRTDRNSFLETCLRAYDEHVPLVLAPDDVWLAVLQAVTKHLELHSEDARKALVDFEGKKLLEVYADDFVKGSADNDWPRVFNQFAGPGGQIEKFLGNKRNMFDPTFSTSTVITKAAMQVQTMAALSPYFDYKVWTRCGIPTVTLLGTVEDWRAISNRVRAFAEFYPVWAHTPLVQVVDEFVLAAQGNADRDFWRNFVKSISGSGTYKVSGEINAFFPYLASGKNIALTAERDAKGSRTAADLGGFPGSVSSVPVLWKYHGTDFKMRLATGCFGTAIDSTSTGISSYRPITGWAIGTQAE
jgi:hypothetical protein